MTTERTTSSPISTSSLRKYTCVALAIALRLLFADATYAQDKKSRDTAKTNHLNEVQIRQLKVKREQTSPTPLQLLSGERLQRMNSLSVADAVRFFSGVQLKDYGGVGGLKTINVRSMGTNHTAVFYDGAQIGNAQNGQVDLGKFSLDNIEEIELYNGQKSTILQPAKSFAAGSSLYLKSKTPVFEDGQADHFRAAVRGGSFNLINPSGLWQHKISDNIYSNLSAEYKDSDGRYKFRYDDSTFVRENGDIEAMRLEGGLFGKLKDSSAWNAKVYYYRDNQGLPGAIVANRYAFPQRLWDRRMFVQSNYTKEVGRYNLIATAKYSNDYSRYLDPELVRVDGLTNNIYKQHELYFSIATRYHITRVWDVALSADYLRNTLDANLYRFPYPTRNTSLVALATSLKLRRFDIQANLLATLVNDRVKEYSSAGDKREYTPTFMASWQPLQTSDLHIRGFYKRIFRMPTFNDLYYTLIGNTFLRPEYTNQYDLGFTYIKLINGNWLDQISLQADAYNNTVKDKIVAVPNASLFRWSMQNLGRVEIRGMDVNLQMGWHIGSVSLNTGATYTYQKAINVTSVDLNYGDQIPYIPLHSGTLILGADRGNWGMNYSYIYTGERYDQSANIPANYKQPWYTSDLALHYNHKQHGGNYRVSAEVNNLFDQQYEVVTSFPMPGRSYRLTLSYTY
ncbi:TonB-dependent receptor [Mucilaginibacter myungsuensis]|uniref:TonB-dependent receptor n=1 Tax=Mucilaginibacter myungsuensis TaxID=649104 RepID=A0A929PWN7_9SPHI|nr:TonB-dependent receptor [Mucilaginibacter myungsuensis]MBE9661372.1 TonB-dependent receptor [Mucilaginibacter myungsuensis]MDN3597515.1 TonB-dependent receptor [Mucilaginibacter myungsuensis]